MKITLRMNEINYDLTPITDITNLHKEIEISISTDGTFNTASFIIPSVEKFQLGTAIDFSRGLIRNSLVTIERDGVEFQWRVMADSLTENQNGTFTHTVQLIDRRSETTGINLPGQTLTQSKSQQGNFVRSISSISKAGQIGNYFYNAGDTTFNKSETSGINIKNTDPLVPISTSIPSANSTVISGRTLKQTGREYTIALSMNIVNTQVNHYRGGAAFGGAVAFVEYTDAVIPYTVNIYANSSLISTESFTIAPAVVKKSDFFNFKPTQVDLSTVQYSKTIKRTPTVEETITVEIILSGTYSKNSKEYSSPSVLTTKSDYLSINDLNLVIYSPDTIDPSRRSLRYHLDRVLGNIFIDEQPIYTLSSRSSSRLDAIISPEFTIEGFNLFQAIQEVADFLGVSWQVTKNNEIDFIFFDDDNIDDIDESEKQIVTASSDLNDYASSVQLNANNIASNTMKKEIGLTVRAIDELSTQITTDNLMIKTEDPINYVDKVMISGISLTLNGIDTLQEWDISDRVLVKEEWDILPSAFDMSTGTTGRNGRNKNNTLYFIRGQKGLHGLSYVGGAEPKFIGTANINRSLFETVAAQAYQATSQSASNKDLGRDTHKNLKISIDYFPFTSSKIHLYKDDQSGFQIERHKYFNESSKVNDPELIGKVAQNNINRLGGTEYVITGYIDTIASIPKLGTVNSKGRRLTKVIIQMTDTYVRFTATYIADYTKISKFVGKKSDYRLYEIPNTAVIDSSRIKRLRILFGSLEPAGSYASNFLNTLIDYKSPVPRLAKLNFKDSEDTIRTVYSTVSTNEFGKTGSWKVKALNNYSFGLKKSQQMIETEEVDFQEEVRYVDNLGRVDSFDITYYSSYKAGDNFPETATDLVTLVPTQSFIYDKDAREIFSFENEISFGSTNIDKYRVYDGIVKYNSFINGRSDYNIECRVLDYIPNKNEIKVDLARTKGLCSVTNSYTQVTVTSPSVGIGLVFYDTISLDILLVVKDTIPAGTYIIPYGTTPDLVYRTVNFYTNGGSSVPNQLIINGTKLTAPTTTRSGYTFLGWYKDASFIYVWDPSISIVTDLNIYAKWVVNSGRTWERVYTSIYDQQLWPEFPSYTCPTDYSTILPNANSYPLGHVVNVTVYRYCNSSLETCYQNPITMADFQICTDRQYRVKE